MEWEDAKVHWVKSVGWDFGKKDTAENIYSDIILEYLVEIMA